MSLTLRNIVSLIVVDLENMLYDLCSLTQSPGVDLGRIPLSRAPHIFRRNTRFAGTVIRPDYQFFRDFGT